MIERKFVRAKMDDYKIKNYLKNRLVNSGFSDAEIEKTPIGTRVIINASKPGLIVGKGGSQVNEISRELIEKFKLENPQVEINEIKDPELDPNIIAERVVQQLIRFGKTRFKAIGYKTLQKMLSSGAVGAEVVISGRIPGQRHKTWRFKGGRLPKSGYVSDHLVKRGFRDIKWNQGSIGITVKILTPDVKTPDDFKLVKEEKKEEKK